MSTSRRRSSLAASAAVALMAAPPAALAAGGRTYEGLLVFFLVACALALVIWAAYYFTPVHRHVIRNDGRYKRVLLPVLGLVAVALGLTAIVTGEVSLGRGSPVLRVLEPGLFWRYVALEIGAGCVLVVLGLLYRPRGS